jgi:hypothetical protein
MSSNSLAGTLIGKSIYGFGLIKKNTFAGQIADPGGLATDPVTPPATPPPAPTVSNSSNDLDIAARQEQLNLQRGRASTYGTGGSGLSYLGGTAKTLFGQ